MYVNKKYSTFPIVCKTYAEQSRASGSKHRKSESNTGSTFQEENTRGLSMRISAHDLYIVR